MARILITNIPINCAWGIISNSEITNSFYGWNFEVSYDSCIKKQNQHRHAVLKVHLITDPSNNSINNNDKNNNII